jgi:GTP-binding protein HflX
LHVRDASHADTEAQSRDVESVLNALGIETEKDDRLIEVWNKIDRLDAAAREALINLADRRAPGRRPVLLSALTGEGVEQLAAAIESRLSRRRVVLDLTLDPADGAGVSWLHRHTEVMEKSLTADNDLTVTVRVDPAKAAAVQAKFGGNRKAG